jgi:hypothetical protein
VIPNRREQSSFTRPSPARAQEASRELCRAPTPDLVPISRCAHTRARAAPPPRGWSARPARSDPVSLTPRAFARGARTHHPPTCARLVRCHSDRGHVELGPLASRRLAACRCARPRTSCSPRWGAERPDPGRHRPRLQPTLLCVLTNADRFQRWTPIVSAHSAPRPHAVSVTFGSRRKWPAPAGSRCGSGGVVFPRGTVLRNLGCVDERDRMCFVATRVPGGTPARGWP